MTQLNTLKYLLGFYPLVSRKIINSNTLAFFFDNVDLIKGCVISPNVAFIKLSTWYLKALLTCKLGLTIYPISNSLIILPVYSRQIKRLDIGNNGRQ